MSDEQDPQAAQDDVTPEQSPARPASARRSTTAASAASRARRIGGLPTQAGARPARPRVADPVDDDDVAADAASTAGDRGATPVSVTKRDRATAQRAKVTVDSEGRQVVTEVPGWLRWIPAAVLGVAAVVTAVFLVFGANGVWYSKPAADSVRDQVLAAAKTCTALTNAYSYKTIPADEAKGARCTTGEQTTRYRSAMSTIVKPSAVKLKATQAVQINAAGVESISDTGDQWTVVLYGQTKITQSGAAPRTDPFSAVVRMDHVADKWLISSISLITSPSG